MGAGVDAPFAAGGTALDRVQYARAVVVTPYTAVQRQVHDALGGHPRAEGGTLLPYAVLDRVAADGRSRAGRPRRACRRKRPSLRLPLPVAREVTERHEAVVAGAAVLVGLDEGRICTALVSQLTDSMLR